MSGGGKGGSTSTSGNSYTDTTSTSYIPDWVNSASQNALGAAYNVAAIPYESLYQAAGGSLVAPTSDYTTQAWQNVANMQGMGMPQYNAVSNTYQGLLGQATPLTTDQIQGLTNQLYSGYGQNVISPTAGLLGGYMQGGPSTAGQVASNAMTLMSPYEQAVINPAMQAGQQALHQNLQQIGAAANQAGAFGGSRQGVQEGVAQAQTSLGESQQIGNLLNQGWQASLTPATQLALQAGTQGYGAAGQLANLISGGYTGEQQQATNLANTNLGLGMTAASQLPGVLQGQQSALTQQAGLLEQAGTAQQQQQQSLINAALANYMWQNYYPQQQLNTLTSTLGSIPYDTMTHTTGYGQQSGTSTYNPSISSSVGGAGQMLGMVGSLLGLL